MAPEELQTLADTVEADILARYERHQQLAMLLADAVKHADALQRLELQLHWMSVKAEAA